MSSRRTLTRVAVWLAGLALAWRLIPVGLRIGWQPPAGQHVVGFLADDRTCVTEEWRTPGPLSLWEFDSGAAVGTVSLSLARVIDGTDLLAVWSVDPAPADPSPAVNAVRVTLVGARAGREGCAIPLAAEYLFPTHGFADHGRPLPAYLPSAA